MRLATNPDEIRHLIEIEKLTQEETAVRLGVSLSCIERTCKRLGLKTQRTGPRSGSLHKGWKGGRILVGGYWYLWTNTHPNRTKQNYIAEHRFFVEQKLGRYLRHDEVVHHINGNSQDNRLENLMVFGSNADHLRHELTGKVPNWTEEGFARMCSPRKPKASDVEEHIQTMSHQKTKA